MKILGQHDTCYCYWYLELDTITIMKVLDQHDNLYLELDTIKIIEPKKEFGKRIFKNNGETLRKTTQEKSS